MRSMEYIKEDELRIKKEELELNRRRLDFEKKVHEDTMELQQKQANYSQDISEAFKCFSDSLKSFNDNTKTIIKNQKELLDLTVSTRNDILGYLQIIYNKLTDEKTDFDKSNDETNLNDACESLLNRSRLTEDEFLLIVKSGYQSKLRLTTEITLGNSINPINTWIVAGVNHDHTINTVDLVSAYAIGQTKDLYTENDGAYGPSQCYENSTVRKWLNTEFIFGFSKNVRDCLRPMVVETTVGNETVVHNDKVKLLSMNELGLNNNHSEFIPPNKEGVMYPIFSHGDSNYANKERVKITLNNYICGQYLTRTSHKGVDNLCCTINYIGKFHYCRHDFKNASVVPVIRF